MINSIFAGRQCLSGGNAMGLLRALAGVAALISGPSFAAQLMPFETNSSEWHLLDLSSIKPVEGSKNLIAASYYTLSRDHQGSFYTSRSYVLDCSVNEVTAAMRKEFSRVNQAGQTSQLGARPNFPAERAFRYHVCNAASRADQNIYVSKPPFDDLRETMQDWLTLGAFLRGRDSLGPIEFDGGKQRGIVRDWDVYKCNLRIMVDTRVISVPLSAPVQGSWPDKDGNPRATLRMAGGWDDAAILIFPILQPNAMDIHNLEKKRHQNAQLRLSQYLTREAARCRPRG